MASDAECAEAIKRLLSPEDYERAVIIVKDMGVEWLMETGAFRRRMPEHLCGIIEAGFRHIRRQGEPQGK